ncbi:hypothetical protein ACJIZ3_022123 [Penstemon smallii]|uniref:Uncharacterized protein n=1 Tax=Penstemon smallii TaxID=265156 RepID=A0ABD3SNF9_9LAMI
MNPITAVDPTAPPPQPPQPPRSSFSCDRHPTEQFNGFCPSCLCERLTTLDHSSSNTPSSSRRPSSASAAIKSLFSSKPPPPPKPSKPTSFFPELRRTKSFSASKNEALGHFFEPQRKSCDVRNTLWSLFSLDDDNKTGNSNKPKPSSVSSSNPQNSIKIESFVAHKPVFEETENEEDFIDPEILENNVVGFVDDDVDDDEGDEIRPVPDSNFVQLEVNSSEIVQEEEEEVLTMKPMKDHIDLDTQEKKNSGGRFWAAASVFSKKWQKWRTKHKTKKPNNGEKLTTLPVEKPIYRQYRETQSEIADYGFGRRSCDVDPRFSLDAGRISFDDPRYSLEEPRASWDGHLIGRSFPKMPPMVSVLEEGQVHVPRTDMQIPVEEPALNSVNGDESVPGGSVQTRDYYLDSSSRRRKSLDRSNSIRKTAAAVVAEIDELKMASNNNLDYFHGARVLVGGRELRDSNSISNSLRDDFSDTFERREGKKSRRWSWKLLGFLHRRNKYEDEEEKYSRVNGVERSLSESWNGDLRNGFNRNMFRSNSSVSWRNSNYVGGVRKSSVEMNGNGKKREEFVLEKNRSARYSPNNHVDNGLLRFYLTPMRGGSRRGIKPNNTQSISRSVLRLY